jgi:hypothetical protein
MRNTLQINKKKLLPVIAGLLFVGLCLKSVTEAKPTSILNQDFSKDIAVYATNTINLEQSNVEDLNVDKTRETVTNAEVISTDDQIKIDKIRNYLGSRNAPLAEYAEEFVKAANHYGIDYRLVASISVIESSGGIHCFRTYNAWGWGKMNFSSFTEGIWTVSKGLSSYYASGLDTPQEIAYRYCPPSAVDWARKVNYVMSVIENS